jgi:hypothetical protein
MYFMYMCDRLRRFAPVFSATVAMHVVVVVVAVFITQHSMELCCLHHMHCKRLHQLQHAKHEMLPFSPTPYALLRTT